MTARLKGAVSALALASSVALLVGDSAAPTLMCAGQERIDITYDFKTDCPTPAAKGRVHFEVPPGQNTEDDLMVSPMLSAQAAAAGLADDVRIVWNNDGCNTSESGSACSPAKPGGMARVAGLSIGYGKGSTSFWCNGWRDGLKGKHDLQCDVRTDGVPRDNGVSEAPDAAGSALSDAGGSDASMEDGGQSVDAAIGHDTNDMSGMDPSPDLASSSPLAASCTITLTPVP